MILQMGITKLLCDACSFLNVVFFRDFFRAKGLTGQMKKAIVALK